MASGQPVSIRRQRTGFRRPRKPSSSPPAPCLRCGRVFGTAPESRDGRPDPLDRWSRRVLDEIAAELDADTAFPFGDPPYWPFLDWSRRAEPLWPSPVGLHVHARIRALVFLPGGAHIPRASGTAPCVEKPHAPATVAPTSPASIPARPMHSGTGSMMPGAVWINVRSEEGEACRTGGCLVRRACPVGVAFIPEPERAAFHMQAFLRSYEAGMGGEAGTN